MSGRSHRFLSITSDFWEVNVSCSRIQHGDLSEDRTLESDALPLGHGASLYYENMPMQYTAIFHCCKNGKFQMKICDIFLIFAQNIDCGYTAVKIAV